MVRGYGSCLKLLSLFIATSGRLGLNPRPVCSQSYNKDVLVMICSCQYHYMILVSAFKYIYSNVSDMFLYVLLYIEYMLFICCFMCCLLVGVVCFRVILR